MKKWQLLLFFFGALAVQAFAQVKPNIDRNGLALSGYDPVSYFKGTPSKGNPKLKASVENRTYYFSSVENRDQFLQSPSTYEPAYGGWCAYAVGKNAELVEIDPLTFKIKDGKLLVFYNKWFTNTLTLWNEDEKTLATSAEKKWKQLQVLTKE